MPSETRRPLAGTGLLATCGAAFAAGVLAGAPTTLRTPALACLFPLAGVAAALARAGRRRLALPAVVLAFGVAGVALGVLPPASRSPCSAILGPAGLPAPDRRSAAALDVLARVRSSEPVERGAALVLDVVGARAGPGRVGPGGADPKGPPGPSFVPVHLRAEVRAPSPAPLPGDGIRAHLTLDDPPAIRAVQLRREGIACTGSVTGARIAVIDPAFAPIAALRRRIATALLAAIGPGPAAGLVLALSVGDRSAIDAAQRTRFADSGLAHLVSISGLHVSLVVLGIFRLLVLLIAWSRVGARLDPPRTAALLTLPAVPLYVLLAGGGPPVTRAGIGAALFLLATAALRAPHAGASLLAAAIAVVAFDPAALFDVSFQLSFAACAGLLLLAPGLGELLPEIPLPTRGPGRLAGQAARALAGAISTTAAATLATLPLTALHFQRTSLTAIPANVAALPVGLAATVGSALAAVVAAVWPRLAGAGAVPAALLARALDAIAAFFAGLPGARVPLPPPGALDAVAAIAAAFALAALRRHPRRSLAVLAAAALAVIVPHAARARGDGLLHVDFLPVGQGDATLLRLPGGGAILVDAGGDLQGRPRSAPVLRELLARDVRALDALVITHLHPDHAGDAPEVLRTLPVGELWTSARPLEGPLGTALLTAARHAGVPLRALVAGERFTRGGVTVEVLGPPPRDDLPYDPLLEENDGSLVLRVVHGDVPLLLAGDVEREGEAALLRSGRPLAAALLKVPHHGSRTSSSAELLEVVDPAFAVFSIGRHNIFGFPHEEVVARYHARGVRTAGTDAGPVSFVSDGLVLRLSE